MLTRSSLDTSCANAHPTSTCQNGVAIDHGNACITPRSGARVSVRSGDTCVRLHPCRRRPTFPQNASFLLKGEADRNECAATATAAVRPPRPSDTCNIMLSRRSFSSDFVPTSTQFRSVSTTRSLNSFFRNASLTHRSLMLRCRVYRTGCRDARVHHAG